MRKSALIGARRWLPLLLSATAGAHAGPWEDGMVAYNRGDYVPAIRLFRPLAEQGNPKAQNVIGVMYRKGEGVATQPGPRLHVVQPCRQTRRCQGEGRMRDVSKTMTPAEISQAEEMAQACEASNYRACEY